MKKYVMPVTEIVTVEMPKLLSGSLAGGEIPVKRNSEEESVAASNIFGETKSADVTDWGGNE